jgi:hypothetical protein
MSETAAPLPRSGRLARWRHSLSTVNPPAGELDPASRWLVITRAGVLPMTLTGGAVAGLLAVGHSGFAAGWYALSFLGIVLAHVSNNLVNDLFDTDTGLAYTAPPLHLKKRGLGELDALLVWGPLMIAGCSGRSGRCSSAACSSPRSWPSVPPGYIDAGAALMVRRRMVRANSVAKISAPRMFRTSL